LTKCSSYVLFSAVTHETDILARKPMLAGLAEMASAMARDCYARFQAAGSDNDAKDRAIAAFDICGRNVRLSIMAEVKLVTSAAAPVFAAAGSYRPARLRTDEDRERDRMRDRETDRERERETDGHPLTPLGRAEALEKAIARNPDLDPDGRYTAQVIDIKARLQGETLPPPEPDPPPAVHQPPANRAERRRLERRMRRASG
jgi:hypothetical protein